MTIALLHDAPPGFKECKRCHAVRLVAEFYAQPRCLDGLSSYCKQCARDVSRASILRHRGEQQLKLGLRKPKPIVTCRKCGQVYDRQRTGYRYCSDECYGGPRGVKKGCFCPGCAKRSGCWYSRKSWRVMSNSVKQRDMFQCYVKGCPDRGTHCDHIEPVHPAMSYHDFHDPANLRAACRRHNTWRGMAARLQREETEGMTPSPRRCVLMSTSSVFRGRDG